MAGDADAARSVLGRLDAIGTRGRAVDADRSAVGAGIAALEGDLTAAIDGYRTAIQAWRDLGVPFDEAMGVLGAVTRLGTATPSEWIETARGTFRRLEAAPLLALLDATIEGARADSAGDDSNSSAAASGREPAERAVGTT